MKCSISVDEPLILRRTDGRLPLFFSDGSFSGSDRLRLSLADLCVELSDFRARFGFEVELSFDDVTVKDEEIHVLFAMLVGEGSMPTVRLTVRKLFKSLFRKRG